MAQFQSRTLILVKARPHSSKDYVETVCCAGVTAEGKWARLYPIPFRQLSQDRRFRRWEWVKYDWRRPAHDARWESQSVQLNTLVPDGRMKVSERAPFLTPLIQSSPAAAASAGMSLALIRPRNVEFDSARKSAAEMDKERQAFEMAARKGKQGSFFQSFEETFEQAQSVAGDLSPLEPCPYRFRYRFETQDNTTHRFSCVDWETEATFYRFRKRHDEEVALKRMRLKFGEELPSRGIVFAIGTHYLYGSWLLVGVIRLDDEPQGGFSF